MLHHVTRPPLLEFPRTLRTLEHLIWSWDTRVGACTGIQGQLGHRVSWDTGPVETQGQLGHTDPPSVAISRYGFEAFE